MENSDFEYSKTLFIFVDESGNFDFKAAGTQNFVLAAFVTRHPFRDASKLLKLKYDLIAEGEEVDYFHATEDFQRIRDRVFNEIINIDSFNAHVVFGYKEFAAESKRNEVTFHTLFAKALVKYCVMKYSNQSTERIIVVFDQALTKKQQKVFHASIKPELKKLGIPFKLIFQGLKYDYCGQIIDYIAWSKFVSLERSEHRPWELLKTNVNVTDFDIFKNNWFRKSDHPD